MRHFDLADCLSYTSMRLYTKLTHACTLLPCSYVHNQSVLPTPTLRISILNFSIAPDRQREGDRPTRSHVCKEQILSVNILIILYYDHIYYE